MKITHLTPGTGNFYCGSCLRDNALALALRRRGHDVMMVPLYLPFVLEEHSPEENSRVFMGGLNMYLQHRSPLFRHLPRWLSSRLNAPALLRWLARHGDMTDSEGLGSLTVATLRGEHGPQAREIEELMRWLDGQNRPDLLGLSNAMLIGIAGRLKQVLGVPIVCTLQGEAPFLDTLPEPYRAEAWSILAERARDVDRFVAVSAYHADLMRERLGLPADKVTVVHNGIELNGLAELGTAAPGEPPTIGYLARLCADKGLPTLVDAFLLLKRKPRWESLRLRAAGVMLKHDALLVERLRQRLREAGCDAAVDFLPNLERDEKLRFLQTLTVLSVPATYGESFGLYLLEAWAAGIPVVQPRHGAFPEILEATGGGLLCEPDDPESLAASLEVLLEDVEQARRLGAAGRRAVHARFTAEHMAERFEAVFADTLGGSTHGR